MGADASAGLTLYPAVASNASFRFNNSLFGSTVLDIDTSNLRVGIGAVGAPKYTLDVSGGTTATGSLLLGTSGSPITLLLANSAGLVGPVALGSNLSFSGSTLSAGTATFGSAAYASSGSFALSGSYVPYSSGYAVSVGAITGSNGLTISGGSTSLGNTAVSGSLTVSSGTNTAIKISGSSSGWTAFAESNTGSTFTISPSGNYGVTQFKGQYASAGIYAVTISSSAATVDWNNGNVQRVVLGNGGNTITLTNAVSGGRYELIVVQPASSTAGTVTWAGTGNNTPKWPAATAPTLSATNSYQDIVSFLCDGTAGWTMGGANTGYH